MGRERCGVGSPAGEPVRLLAPTPCLPGDSAGASLSALCVRGSGLAAVTWRWRLGLDATQCVCFSRGRGPWGLLSAAARPLRGLGCFPGPGVGRVCRREPGGGPRARPGSGGGLGPRGFGFLGAAPPLPRPGQSPPCAPRGRERKAGRSYFSKLLSSGRGLPGDSRGGREGRERPGAVIFRSRDPAESPPPPRRLRVPTRRGPGAETPVWRPGRGGRGDASKVAVSLPRWPQPPGRGRAHSGDPGGPDPHPAGSAGSALVLPPGRRELGRHVRCGDERGSRSRADVEGGSPGCRSRT